MAQDILNKYIWLADTIYRAGRISFKDINSKWSHSSLYNEKAITKRTFHNHRVAIEQLFDINIECDNVTNEYYIENAEDFGKSKLINWLLNSFSISNIIRESKDIHKRVVLEEIPSAQLFLTELITSMRDNSVVIMIYHPFWSEKPIEIQLYPYFVKLFNKRWYVYGRTETEEKVKVYGLDRIKELTMTEKKFVFPAAFSAIEHLYDSIGIMKTDTDKPCEIRIKAYGETSQYLQALPIHHSQHEIEITKEYTLFSYRLSPTEDFYQEILSKREYLEVVSPKYVKEKLADIIRKLSIYYL